MPWNDEDAQEFDAAEESYKALRDHAGATAVEKIGESAKTAAQVAWTFGKPVAVALGQAGLEALKAYAMSQLNRELDRLAGTK
jgi:hypothetical protein